MIRRIRLAEPRVTALLYAAEPSRGRALVLAHGAGASQRHPFMVAYAKGLRARGVDVLTFDFPYMERGAKLPDGARVLEACWRAVLAFARKRLPGRALFIGGKSMGGRIASQIAAGPDVGDLAGLVFLGYPLHPPGRPAKLRAEHLPRVRAPMLFVQGARDAFGSPEEIAAATRDVSPRPAIVTVPDGDHSFMVRKSLGVPQARIHEDAIAAVDAFLLAHASS